MIIGWFGLLVSCMMFLMCRSFGLCVECNRFRNILSVDVDIGWLVVSVNVWMVLLC